MSIILARILDRFITGDVDHDTYNEKLIQSEIKRIKLLVNCFLILAYATIISLMILAMIAHFNPNYHWFIDVPIINPNASYQMVIIGLANLLQIIFLHLLKANFLMLQQPHKRHHLTYATLYVTCLLPLILTFIDTKSSILTTTYVLANACLLATLYLTQRQSFHLK